MPTVSRLSGTHTDPEGFAVETESSGDTYRYTLRVTDERDPTADDADDALGTVELTERTRNGQPVESKATETVRDVMNEYGFEVEA
jgi:hypothetical protein